MQIELTLEQQEFVRRAIDQGRFKSAEDAVRKALEAWVESERRREELLVAIDEAETAIANGESIVISPKSMHELAEDIKRRGRMRLAGSRKPIG